MIVGETVEDYLVSTAEFVSLPEEKIVGNLTAVRKANSVKSNTGTSGSSFGGHIGIEDRLLKKIQVTEAALKFTPDEMATYFDLERSHLKGLLKEESVGSVPEIGGAVFETDTLMRVRRYYYDYRGRIIQIKVLDSDGWASCVSTKYDFAGNVTGTLESHTSPAGKTNTVKTLRTLDQRGVVLSEKIYADGNLLTGTDYIYDELMRPVGKSTGSVSETFAYDIRGWQTGHAADRGSDRIYSETLRYMTLPEGSGSVARWTRLISESETLQYGPTPARNDSYVYDAIGRLTSSNNENNISYDANGNVTALRRLSATGATIANLSMSYNDGGNRLQSVTNTGTEDGGTFTYSYDSAGNLTSDGRNLLEIQNNVLNLPMRVNQSGTMGGTGTSTMTYTYLGDGTRAAARAGVDATSYAGKRYRGTFVYDVTAGGVQSLESVAVSTGRLIALTGTNGAVSFESDGFITDHLGNVAVVVNLSASDGTSTDNVILEQNEYTPFGTKLNASGLKSQAANRWRYAGKEEQDIAGMNLRLLDFGARYYDSFTCRWNAVDPLAYKYFPMSPYNYCGNDPVNKFDPDGRKIVFSKNCSDDFKNKFKAAVNFMNAKGTSSKMAQLEKSQNVYYIADGRGKKHRNSFVPSTSTISWDPDSMFETDEGIYTSSTTILSHEIDHANEYDKNPEQYRENSQPNSDEQFGNKEERRACENEQKTAEKHGEVKKGQTVRRNHTGGEYLSNGGASPEEQSKVCREHNEAL